MFFIEGNGRCVAGRVVWRFRGVETRELDLGCGVGRELRWIYLCLEFMDENGVLEEKWRREIEKGGDGNVFRFLGWSVEARSFRD